MIDHPSENTLQLTRQQIHDIRDMAQAGCDWEAVRSHLKLPLQDVRNFVHRSLPNCVPFFENASDAKKIGGN